MPGASTADPALMAHRDAGSYRPAPPNDAACVSCFRSSNSPADGPNVWHHDLLRRSCASCLGYSLPITASPLQCDFNTAAGCFMVDNKKPYGEGRGCCDEDGYLIKKDPKDTSDKKFCSDLELAAKEALAAGK